MSYWKFKLGVFCGILFRSSCFVFDFDLSKVAIFKDSDSAEYCLDSVLYILMNLEMIMVL